MSDRWVWMTFADDGRETPIGAVVLGVNIALDAPTRKQAVRLMEVALQHGQTLGQDVWLRHFRSVRDYKLEDL
jgi:hypothetical protein